MRMRSLGWALLSLGLIGSVWLAGAYDADLRRHAARLEGASQLADTACGPIEFAEAGHAAGPPLLVIHGSGGGFDQGLLLAQDFVARGWRVIAPSRFGYLRTPMPADASGERQADHLACLLEHLRIDRAAVMGVSAGGISALHLAVRHPARVQALVLMVPAVHRPDPAVPTPGWALAVLDAVISADFPFWLLLRTMPDTMRRLVLATPAEVYHAASPEDQRRADAVMDLILPVSRRRLGLLNDSRLTTHASRVALEAITAPTLAISARDDGYGTYASARYSAEHIPGARFLGFDTGGHALLGRQAEVAQAIDALMGRAGVTPAEGRTPPSPPPGR